LFEGLVVPDTTGIRLQTAAGTPSFDSEGQVQGRLEVKVGDTWVTIADGDDLTFGGVPVTSFESGSEATVACRQLGDELGFTLVSASKVGKDNTDDGVGEAYEVTCSGAEATLESCTSFEYYRSSSSYDVGVSCTFLAVAPGDECEECVAGKFSDTSGVAACTSCAAGSYSTVGAASCQQVRWDGGEASAKTACRSRSSSSQCEAGKASASPAATSVAACTTCPSGTYANAAIGATECTNCAAGSYSTVVGSVSAADCQQVRVEGG
jgi:hypothetical protein